MRWIRHLTRKNRRLAQILGIQLPGALGYVEALLHVTAEHAPAGNIGRLSNRDIAEEMFYTLDPDELIAAFVASEWLERSDQHRLIVHHWSKHSDDTTDVKLARHGSLYADGSRPRMSRLSNAERATLCAKYGWPEHIKPQEATLCHNVALPEPVPEPETVPVEPSHSAQTRPNGVNGANALAEGNLFPTVQENQADPPPPARASQKTSDTKVPSSKRGSTNGGRSIGARTTKNLPGRRSGNTFTPKSTTSACWPRSAAPARKCFIARNPYGPWAPVGSTKSHG
jgi:hypothetical protein